MPAKRFLPPVAMALSVAVFASGLVAFARSRSDDTGSASGPQPTLAPAPLAVTLTTAGLNRGVTIGARVVFAVEAVGPAVARIELWDGDIAAGAVDIDGAPEGAGHSFEWVALRPGRHLLHASARGSGGIAHSASFPVEVLVAPLTPELLPLSVAAPVASAALARSGGIPADTITGTDTSGAQVEPSAPTTTFVLNTVKAAEAAAGEITTNKSPATAEPPATNKPPATSKPPATAGLVAKVDGCKVTLSAPGGSGNLVAYRSDAGSVGFAEVGSIHDDAPIVLEHQRPGPMVFVAGPKGEPTTLGPVEVNLPESCLKELWKGNASLVSGVLTLPEPIDTAFWVYLSADGKPARRIPDDPLATFHATGRKLDITQWLPAIEGTELHLEVWAYGVGQDEARKVAAGDAKLPKGMSATALLGESSASWLNLTPAKLKVADTRWIASWGAASGQVDRVVWQMTTQPLDTSTVSLNPPGLVASGVAKRQGTDPARGAGATGVFNIPVPPYGTKGTSLATSKPLDLTQIDSGAASNLPEAPAKLIDDPKHIDLTALGEDPITSPTVKRFEVAGPPVITSDTYFIRIIPLSGATPLGSASAPVRADLPVKSYPPQAPMTVTSTVFDGGHVANPDLHGCIRVTSLPAAPPQGPAQPAANGSKGLDGMPLAEFDRLMIESNYTTIGTYCPGDWKTVVTCKVPQAFCDAWNAFVAGATWVMTGLTKIWDMIATVYNGIIEGAVLLITTLNPYCIGATIAAKTAGSIDFTGMPGGSLASDAAKEATAAAKDFCDKVGPVIARAAVGSILAFFGLPPSLPSSEQLLAIAQGNLVELAVMYLKDLGVPCDDMVIDASTAGAVTDGIKATGGYVPPGVSDGVDVCRDALAAALGGIKQQVVEMTQSQIRSSTGLPMPSGYVKGFEFVFEPRAFYRPPTLTLDATPRDDGTPFYAVCDAELSAFMGGAKTDQRIATYVPTRATLRPAQSMSAYDSTKGKKWSATAQFDIAESSPFFNKKANIDPFTPLVANVKSDCLVGTSADTASGSMGPKGSDAFASVGPAEGRWHPGDSH